MADEVINGIRTTYLIPEIKRNTKNLLTGVWTPGTVFYVDTGGSDTNSGLSLTDPLLKVDTAVGKCTANAGDVIQVMGNSPTTPNDTGTITVDVAGVTIRGLYGRGLLSDSGFGSPTENVPCLTIAANFVTIENLFLGTDVDGSTGGIIEFTGNTWGTTFRNCLFDTQYISAYGIYAPNDQPYLLIEDCVFGGTWIAGYTTAGIHIGNLTGGMIRRNVFNKIQGIAINAGLQAGSFQILNNQFNLPSDTVGKAITLADGSFSIFIDGNRANYGISAMTNNPYRDLNNDDSNTWGLNYKGGIAVMPATA